MDTEVAMDRLQNEAFCYLCRHEKGEKTKRIDLLTASLYWKLQCNSEDMKIQGVQ
jgi:hypothetical protein